MWEDVHLCLSDLLDQDVTSQEYFNTLPGNVRKALLERDEARTFGELQQQAEKLKSEYNGRMM